VRKMSKISKIICVFVAASFIYLPMFAVERGNSSRGDAARDAETQAIRNINTTTWFIVGCLGGVLGWVAAMVIIPNPPVTELLGQSSDYVAVYTDVYRDKAKKIQTSKAFTGCLISTAVGVVLEVIVLATAPKDIVYYY
jgi:hypothetical protein